MVRPKPTPPAVPEPENITPPEPPPVEEEEDTLSKATGWLRRSLNLGKKPDGDTPVVATEPEAPAAEEPTQVMSLFEIEEAEQVATQAPRATKAPTRFVLKFPNGSTITVGERQGIMGVKPVGESDTDEIQRVYLEDETDTVAPEHVEFGVARGVFWVKDLKTVNGTVVQEPGASPLQCIPFDTYQVVRGSTVTLGSLSFTLH